MLSTLVLALGSVLLYIAWLLFRFVQNVLAARKLGFPQIWVPGIVQNGYFWMIFGPVNRLQFKKRLPTWLYERLELTIYGFEFFQKSKPFDEHAVPQVRRNPKLAGGGKTYTLVTSGGLELISSDREIAAAVLGRPQDFRQNENASLVLNVFGSNVLTTDGSEWVRHRRIVAGAVTDRINPIVWKESIRQTRGLLASIRDNGNAASGCTTHNMFDLVKRVTIHVLYAAGMGNQQDFDGEEEVPKGMNLTYIEAVKAVNENAAGPTVLPTSLLLNYPSFLPGKAWATRLGQAKLEYPIHTRKALAREKALEAELGTARNNVMSALISASERNEGGDVEKSGARRPGLSEEELIGNLYIFTAAGFDTTANTLAYALVLLARYPQWQYWICEELDTLLPEDRSADFDFASVYLKAHRIQAILYETLRLFPSILHLTKMTQTNATVTTNSAGEFTVPPKTTVYINSIQLHRDPEVWRDLNMTPAERAAICEGEAGILHDEDVFRPSRWINPPGSSTPLFNPPIGTYIPWSEGPRRCPGRAMAKTEFSGILSTLFSQHRLEVVRKERSIAGTRDAVVPEDDDAVYKRLDALIATTTPIMTLEMDVYNTKPGEDRGLGLRWIPRP
jgi:cytochrome P450